MAILPGPAPGRPTPGSPPYAPPGRRDAAGTRQALRAHLDYDADGTLLFRLTGHEEQRFIRVLDDFRAAVPLGDREWTPQLEAWLLYGGWDEELLELLEDHFEPEEVFVSGHPLRTEDED